MKRRLVREKAMQVLYQIEVGKSETEAALGDLIEKAGEQKEYLRDLIYGIEAKKDEIDKYIRKHLRGWSLERIAHVDRAILRIAVYEMLFRPDVPYQVAINEAVELAKKYSDDEAARYINGVLSSIAKETVLS
jgi:N utilization substance protein B